MINRSFLKKLCSTKKDTVKVRSFLSNPYVRSALYNHANFTTRNDEEEKTNNTQQHKKRLVGLLSFLALFFIANKGKRILGLPGFSLTGYGLKLTLDDATSDDVKRLEDSIHNDVQSVEKKDDHMHDDIEKMQVLLTQIATSMEKENGNGKNETDEKLQMQIHTLEDRSKLIDLKTKIECLNMSQDDKEKVLRMVDAVIERTTVEEQQSVGEMTARLNNEKHSNKSENMKL